MFQRRGLGARRLGPAAPRHPGTGLEHTQRAGVAGIEGIDPPCMCLADLQPTVHLPGTHSQHPTHAGLGSQPQGIGQVLRSIGYQRRGWAHGAGQHHRLGWAQEPVQQVGGFLQRVGAVGHHHAGHRVVGQQSCGSRQQRAPHAVVHVLAVHLRHLFGAHRHAQRQRHAGQQLGHRHHTGRVAHVVGRVRGAPRYRAARAQHHHLRRLAVRGDLSGQQCVVVRAALSRVRWLHPENLQCL
jgi:hypothetical protein